MSSKKNAGALDYEIGFGKPPSEHWFKPGQSGNPAGRPRKPPASPPKEGGLTSIEASILRVMRGTVKVKSGEKARWIASTDALAEQLLAQALGGDMRATRLLLNLNRDAEAQEAQILAAEHKQVDPLVFAALAEALLLGSKRNALDSDALADGAPSGGDDELANAELDASRDEIGLEASRSHLEPGGCTAEGSLTNAAPELITPNPEVHSPPSPLPKPEAPVPPMKPAAQAFRPQRRGDPLIANTAPIVGVGWGVSGHGPPTPVR